MLPTTFGSAPRRVRQRASLTTATRLEPGTSSAVPKARPRAAETPRVVKKRPSTMAAVRFTGSPTPGHVAGADARDEEVGRDVRQLRGGGAKVVHVLRRVPAIDEAAAGPVVSHLHEAGGIGEGPVAEEDGPHHAEDRGVGADAECQGREGDKGEAGRPPQVACGVAEIGPVHGATRRAARPRDRHWWHAGPATRWRAASRRAGRGKSTRRSRGRWR